MKTSNELTESPLDPATPTCGYCGARVHSPCSAAIIPDGEVCQLPPGTIYDHDADSWAFRVFNPRSGKEYKIWANGRIDGFGDSSVVINKIPALIKGHEAREPIGDVMSPAARAEAKRERYMPPPGTAYANSAILRSPSPASSSGLPDDWFEEHDGQMLVLIPAKVMERIDALEAQLAAEGEHTAAANANIDRLNTEIERVTRRQQGPMMGKDDASRSTPHSRR